MLQLGATIYYLLRVDQYPKNPKKIWLGEVRYLYSSEPRLIVRSLSPGYEGLEEDVLFSQILQFIDRETEKLTAIKPGKGVSANTRL